MTFRAGVRSWWRSFRNRSRLSAEMEEEMQFHIESYRKDLIRSGVTAEEADRRARLEFGSRQYHKEDCRQALGLRLLGELAGDLQYGMRMLRRDRMLTAIAVLSLAIGVGANSVVFSVAKTVMLDPLGVERPEELRLLAWQFPGQRGPMNSTWGNQLPGAKGAGSYAFSYAAYCELSKRSDIFSGLAAYSFIHDAPLSSAGEYRGMVSIQLVSQNFFEVLCAKAEAGRLLSASDNEENAVRTAVISDGFWARQFGRSRDALGKVVSVNRVPVTIVGVVDASFRGANIEGLPDVLMSLASQPAVDPTFDRDKLRNDECWWLQLLGRVKAGVPDERAKAELDSVLKQV